MGGYPPTPAPYLFSSESPLKVLTSRQQAVAEPCPLVCQPLAPSLPGCGAWVRDIRRARPHTGFPLSVSSGRLSSISSPLDDGPRGLVEVHIQ